MTPDGIINIYKEKNMTSHDVVGHIRRILGVRRVGHTGTLDPMATGVLPVCVGRSAKVMEYLDTDLKKYRCTMLLGRTTNTYDIWGEPEEEAPEEEVDRVTEKDVLDALDGFRGRISQLPPLYSAVKVNGKRLYEYARKGRDVDIPRREVYITSLEVEDMELGHEYDSWVRFSCECTKGTFIRSICHDAGEALGVHAVLSELERTASGVFTADTAVTLDDLRNMCGFTRETEPRGNRSQKVRDDGGSTLSNDVLAMLRPPDDVLGMFGAVDLKPETALRLINGLEIERRAYEITEFPEYSRHEFYFPVREEYSRMYRLYSNIPDDMVIPGRPEGVQWYPERNGRRFIGLAEMNEDNGHLIPEKIFI